MIQEKANKADRVFLLLACILVVFGLIMLASASAPLGYIKFGDTYYFLKRQVLFGLIPGAILLLIFARIDYRFWKKFAWALYALSLVTLALVWVPGIGAVINGSRSWIYLYGFSFQPSELGKLAIVVMLAYFFADNEYPGDWQKGLISPLAVISPIILFIALQDVGTLSILIMTIFAMLYLAGVRKYHLFVLGVVGLLGFVGLLVVAPYRVSRLTTFLHPELDPKGVGYQINQAFLGIGSGGLWGLGLGHSRQKFQYLPEVQSDSVFAVICEEMGFLISSAMVFLIAFFGMRGLKIAKGAPDRFGRLLAGGIMVWFLWQSFLNISAIIGLLPLTGVPLTFVSQGGTALMIELSAIGIVANISKYSKI